MIRPRLHGHARRRARSAAATAVAAAALLAVPAAGLAAAPPAADGWSAPVELSTNLPLGTTVVSGGIDAADRAYALAIRGLGGGNVDVTFARRALDRGPGDAEATASLTGVIATPPATGLGPDGNAATIYAVSGAAAGTYDFHVLSLNAAGVLHDAVLLAGVPGTATLAYPQVNGPSAPFAVAFVYGDAVHVAHAVSGNWRVDTVPGVPALAPLRLEAAASGALVFAGYDNAQALDAGVWSGGAWHAGQLAANAGANPIFDSVAVTADGRAMVVSQAAASAPDVWLRDAGGAWTDVPAATSDDWYGAFDERGPYLVSCQTSELVSDHLVAGAWQDDIGYFRPACTGIYGAPAYDAAGDDIVVGAGGGEVRHVAGANTAYAPVGQAPFPYMPYAGTSGVAFGIGRAGEAFVTAGWIRAGHVDLTFQAYGQTPRAAGAPAVAGEPVAGGSLTCTPAAATGAVTTAAWWTRDGVRVASGSAPLRLTSADVGHRVACLAVYGDALGTSQETSTPLRVAVAGGPAFTRLPAIVGTAAVGATVRCGGGAASGGTLAAGSIWLRDGVVVARPRTRTYRVGVRDAGHALQCALTARGAAGTTVASSAPRVVRDACTVPALAGLPLRAARTLLAASGCRVGAIHRVAGRGRHGAVVRSAPRAGATLRPRARVALWLRR